MNYVVTHSPSKVRDL